MKQIKKLLLPLVLSASFLVSGCRKKPAEPVQPAVPDIIEATLAPSAIPSSKPEQTAFPEVTPDTAPEPSAEPSPSAEAEPENTEEPAASLPEDTRCDDKDCVALYVYTYGHLPSNYMTKKEARKRGWQSGALSAMLKGMAIGGDRFGNMEGYLPDEYRYYECDIDTIGKKKRGAKRIIFAEGGVVVYYTEDHYETFELLYGEE